MANKTASLVRATDEPWVPISRGVDLKVLRVSEETGFWTTLVRFTPSGVLPRHWHLSASEFLVLQGQGNHPQAGDFEPGDYFYEHNGAFHDEVTTDEEVILFMVSHGPSAFIGPDDSVQYVVDATSTKKMVEQRGQLSKWFIVKAVLRSGLSRLIPLPPPFGESTEGAAERIQPGSLPWLPIAEGVDLKVLHISDEMGFWSTLMRLQPGALLPRRWQLTASECYVVKGRGSYSRAQAFETEDFIYEHNGSFQEEMTAQDELLLFKVNYGPWAFVGPDDSVQRIWDTGAIRELISQQAVR